MYVRKLTRADVSMAAFTSEFNVSNVCSVRANYSSHAYLSPARNIEQNKGTLLLIQKWTFDY